MEGYPASLSLLPALATEDLSDDGFDNFGLDSGDEANENKAVETASTSELEESKREAQGMGRRKSLGTMIGQFMGGTKVEEGYQPQWPRRRSLGTHAAETLAIGTSKLLDEEFKINRDSKRFVFCREHEAKWAASGSMTMREYTASPEHLSTNAQVYGCSGAAKIAEYSFKKGTGKVLCVHDRQCNAGQFKKIAEALQKKRMSVLLFDDDGHGLSGVRSSQTYQESLHVLEQFVAHHYQHSHVKMAVTHGFGSFLFRIALAKGMMKVDRLVMLCAPSPSLLEQTQFKFAMLGPKGLDAFINGYRARFGQDSFESMTATRIPEGKILNIRAKNDRLAHEHWWRAWRELDGDSVKMISLKGSNHMRILTDGGVIQEILTFFAQGSQ